MAVRREDLSWQGSAQSAAVVYRFPPVRARRLARAEVFRRRLALGTIGLVVMGAGLFATGPGGVAPAAPKGKQAVVVYAGDTLWDIASKHAPEHVDVRSYLDAILELNQIGPVVDIGTRIRLP